MTRRSLRQQVASTSSTPKKRASPADGAPRKQAKRAKIEGTAQETPKTTPRKSQYFETSQARSDTEPASDTEIENEESGYSDEDEAASLMSTPRETEGEEEEEDVYSEEDTRSKKKAKGVGSGTKGAVVKGKELWRPGVKTGLGPGQDILIKLPKARDPGKTPYEDNTIHPNTMLFLKDLKENNDREWLKSES